MQPWNHVSTTYAINTPTTSESFLLPSFFIIISDKNT